LLYKKIEIIFDENWLDKKADIGEKNLIELFVEHFKKAISAEVEVLELTKYSCVLALQAIDGNDDINEEKVRAEIEKILRDKFGAGQKVKNLINVNYIETRSDENSVKDVKDKYHNTKKEIDKSIKAEDYRNTIAAAEEKKSDTNVLQVIDSLVGAYEFKQLARECALIKPQVVKNEVHDIFAHRSYLFAINDGCGLTTYLESFANLLSELNLAHFGTGANKFEEFVVPMQKSAGLNQLDPFDEVRKQFNMNSPYSKKILCIDICEWMSKIDDRSFQKFISELADNSEKFIYVFRVPFVEKEVLYDIKRKLSKQLYIKEVSFTPLSIYELTKIGMNVLNEYYYKADDDVWNVFQMRIAEEKRNGKFYGIKAVNRIIKEMIYYKLLSNAETGKDNTHIRKDEILQLAENSKVNELTGEQMLEELVGMEAIKDQIDQIVAQIELAKLNSKLTRPCLHMRFEGNPGTGKTTAARILGKILNEKGILRNGNFFEYAGRDFCGRYVGETAPKTAGMCRDAYGSIMFIDEAYALYDDDELSVRGYGKEVIETLVTEMENHRSDFVVIMAGYPDKMANLMNSNNGLASRMPYIIKFPNYTRAQLHEIYMRMATRDFEIEDGLDEVVKEYFEQLSDEIIEDKDFSNARFVRNLYERTWGKSAMRAQIEHAERVEIKVEDFISACSDPEFRKKISERMEKMGF